MRKFIRKMFQGCLILIFLFPIALLLLIRFTDGEIGNGPEKILLGYDESRNTWQFDTSRRYDFDGTDGPYIFGRQLIRVDNEGQVRIDSLRPDSIDIFVDNEDQDHFKVKLMPNSSTPPDQYSFPKRLLALSDIEGNFNAFSSLLIQHEVMSPDYRWTFGSGGLVLLGDCMDRGKHVLPVLWLIYHLEQQAIAAGGQVHFIIGNHEVMNFQGHFRNAQDKYKALALAIGMHNNRQDNYRRLYSPDSFLGQWMRRKNVIERIGPYLFVHAGLNPDLLDHQLSINDINRLVRQNWDQDVSADSVIQ
ncbi:MAG: metallophosphoesterase, partial [Bacteroidota bacterium]